MTNSRPLKAFHYKLILPQLKQSAQKRSRRIPTLRQAYREVYRGQNEKPSKRARSRLGDRGGKHNPRRRLLTRRGSGQFLYLSSYPLLVSTFYLILPVPVHLRLLLLIHSLPTDPVIQYCCELTELVFPNPLSQEYSRMRLERSNAGNGFVKRITF